MFRGEAKPQFSLSIFSCRGKSQCPSCYPALMAVAFPFCAGFDLKRHELQILHAACQHSSAAGPPASAAGSLKLHRVRKHQLFSVIMLRMVQRVQPEGKEAFFTDHNRVIRQGIRQKPIYNFNVYNRNSLYHASQFLAIGQNQPNLAIKAQHNYQKFLFLGSIGPSPVGACTF